MIEFGQPAALWTVWRLDCLFWHTWRIEGLRRSMHFHPFVSLLPLKFQERAAKLQPICLFYFCEFFFLLR